MTVLYVFPHPDDESFGPGPVLAQQQREGHAVHLLTLTKGGATKVRHDLGLSVEEMGEVRAREMQCVAEALDLSSLTVLDFPDGGLADLDPREIERAVEERVRTVRPDVLVTYAVQGVSGHPDHLVSHAVVKRLFCRLRDEWDAAPRRLALFTVVEREGNPDVDRPVRLNRTPPSALGARVVGSQEDMERARRALDCYETYRGVIQAHDPLAEVEDGVPFVLFGEEVETPLPSLLDALPEATSA